MKATILLGTLKKTGLSNTETLCKFLSGRMGREGIGCEIVKLINHRVMPGTYSNIGKGDEWPSILEQLLDSEIVILAMPVWWGNRSSEIQRVVEPLDELHDKVMAAGPSPLGGKVGGVVINTLQLPNLH